MMPDKPLVLVVDDEAFSRRFLETVLVEEGFACSAVETAQAFWSRYQREEPPDLILLDVRLPDGDGLKVLETLRAQGSPIPVIVITAYGSIAEAVNAMKLGAFDFFTKPFEDVHKIKLSIKNALEQSRLLDENRRLKAQIHGHKVLRSLIGESRPMQDVLELVRKAARTGSHVLLEGESGTGKELAAEAIHQLSDRRHQPFIPINCAALPEALLESALFGYEKGAFTGAVKTTAGFFEEAQGGTLFLDEIGEASPSVQAKILRAVEEGTIYRVGRTKPISFNVRLIFATNKDLGREAAAGKFRRDLYFRINIIKINLPPLRERRGDIPLLANYFLDKYCREAKTPKKKLHPGAIAYLLEKRWPGNVRELKNLLERVVALHPEEEIAVEDLRRYEEEPWEVQNQDLFDCSFDQARKSFEHMYFQKLIRRAAGDPNLAAELSGMHLATIYRKLKTLKENPDR
ncbi:MAG: sigma-54 dependent transcriptional regulator [Thermodesulfobacteriota bacterium]